MIGAILAGMLAVEAQAAAPSQTPPSPPPDPIVETQNNLDQAEQVYMQSCGDRAYAAYDDLCSQLKTQIHQYRIDLDQLKRTAAATARPPKP
jgi:hypothetical protein